MRGSEVMHFAMNFDRSSSKMTSHANDEPKHLPRHLLAVGTVPGESVH